MGAVGREDVDRAWPGREEIPFLIDPVMPSGAPFLFFVHGVGVEEDSALGESTTAVQIVSHPDRVGRAAQAAPRHGPANSGITSAAASKSTRRTWVEKRKVSMGAKPTRRPSSPSPSRCTPPRALDECGSVTCRMCRPQTLTPFVCDAIAPGSTVLTDGWAGYDRIASAATDR
jgi:hypothetical protein